MLQQFMLGHATLFIRSAIWVTGHKINDCSQYVYTLSLLICVHTEII